MSTDLAKIEQPVVAMLSKYKTQIEDVLPKHLTPIRVLKMIVGSLNKNPALLACSPMSVINAVLTACQMGLEITPGQAYLVPFKTTCTLIIDYRGKIDMALRTGKVLDIDLEIVYSKEKFRIFRDENGYKRIEHEPILYKTDDAGDHLPITEKDRGVPVGAYAVAVLKDAPPKIVFMPAIDIEAIRKRSKAASDGPWVTDPMEMWKKTVCHRICKILPSSSELRTAQEVEDRAEAGDAPMRVIDAEEIDEAPLIAAGQGAVTAAVETGAKASALAEKITRASKKVSEPVAAAPAAVPVVATPSDTSVMDKTWQDRIVKEVESLPAGALTAILKAKVGSPDIEAVTLENYRPVWDAISQAKQAAAPAVAAPVAADGKLF